MSQDSNNKKKPPKFKGYVRYSQIGMEMAITIAGLTVLGLWLDSKFTAIAPFGVIIGSLLGVGVSLYRVIKAFL